MNSRRRIKVVIRGAVQGVGFRPFVFRLATERHLGGWVLNSPEGVFLEAEGTEASLQDFLLRLESEKPAPARIVSLETTWLDSQGDRNFQILESKSQGTKSASILPDIATCTDCVAEILDPANRRYRYPFTNCTHCGPRFTIIRSLPYDRPNTAMKKFKMCKTCEEEYQDPRDRRFHAQPNACPDCGPQLELWDGAGRVLAKRDPALREAAQRLQTGEILAVKGIGGFQLMVDARNEEAVERLRRRKSREEKPFALIFPDLLTVGTHCHLSPLEERLLNSPEAPIVLLRHKLSSKTISPLAANVAPGNPNLGVMLPYSPLHHLLLRELGFPIIATSGNLNDEPICIDEKDALERLQGLADTFLVHDRPILRHADDSVARIILGRELILRRARGYAPLPLHFPKKLPHLLAVGAHLKNTVALSVGQEIFLSQHIGDLATGPALRAFTGVLEDFENLYDCHPEALACDQHPEYLSTKLARNRAFRIFPIQHHHAHVAACMAENQLEGPVLGIAWDGIGYGSDGTLWGGEFLRVSSSDFKRVGHLRTFRLPGGNAAIREPRRSALGLLFECFGETAGYRKELPTFNAFGDSERRLLNQMLTRGTHSPLTSSAGRLFDGIASLVGLRHLAKFEGQAAMELEFCLQEGIDGAYELKWQRETSWIFDWQPMILQILQDLRTRTPRGVIAAKFHNTLIEAMVALAERVGEPKVVLTGGCFQNRYLTERGVRRLRGAGFQVYWHQRIPPNDGGIALGQAVVAAQRLQKSAVLTKTLDLRRIISVK